MGRKGRLLREIVDKSGGNSLESEPISKAMLALAEAKRFKRLISHVRYLFRNSTNAHDPKVQELKSYLEKKPPTPKKTDGYL